MGRINIKNIDMRFFIALEISDENKSQLEAVQQKLSILIPQARITDYDKFHLTFAFIGEQNPEIKDDLVDVLAHATKGIKPFEITPAYIDGFPNIHEPKVIWAGVKDDIDKIIILRERIKDRLDKMHLDTDARRFIPHITLAKLNNNYEISLEVEERLQQIMSEMHFTPIKIHSIKLFESVPDQGFHKHNTLAEIELT